MHDAKRITECSAHYLQQVVDVLLRLSDDQYARQDPPLYTSSVGAHIRHTLDHYFNLLDGLDGGHVDYEARRRDPRIESDRRYAIEQVGKVIDRITPLATSDAGRPLTIRIETGDDDSDEMGTARSTLARELDFLLSHMIHHYGLIAMILRAQHVDPGAEFGIAPSTLRYMRDCAACAR